MNMNITGNEWADATILTVMAFSMAAIAVGIAIAGVKAGVAGIRYVAFWLLGTLKAWPDRVLAGATGVIAAAMFWNGKWADGVKAAIASAIIVAVGIAVRKLIDYARGRRWLPSGKIVVGASGDGIASYGARNPEISFAHVMGMNELKSQLMEAVRDHRKSRKNGILLSGDPGNGKTFIAEAFAGELKWGFMPITIGDIKSKWMGQTTEQLQAVFNAAKRSGKLVLFFDECDSMLTDRGSMMNGDGAASQDILQTANTFLTNIVDIRKHKDIIVIAATNYPDKLDTAAIRDGRFDFKIHIPNPDAAAIRGLLEKFSKDRECQPVIPEDVMKRLTRRWSGFSVARIRSIAEKILKNAKAHGRKEVSLDDAFAALRQVQASFGNQVGEDTPTLKDGGLHFDPAMKAKLTTLATRLENIDEVERLGGSVPKGAIFWGPPGTGKTAVAKSLAKTSGWAFLATTGSDLLFDNGGGFDKMLDKAKDLRPCIVFIDEAEQALGDRSRGSALTTLVTNKILAATDGVQSLHDVLFIAATNHPSLLDSAITRGGRFSELFEFKNPEDDTVLKLVQAWIDGKRSDAPFHEEFTPEAVAKFLEGMSPADIRDYLQQAVNAGVGRILAGDSEEKIMLGDLKAVLQG